MENVSSIKISHALCVLRGFFLFFTISLQLEPWAFIILSAFLSSQILVSLSLLTLNPTIMLLLFYHNIIKYPHIMPTSRKELHDFKGGKQKWSCNNKYKNIHVTKICDSCSKLFIHFSLTNKKRGLFKNGLCRH